MFRVFFALFTVHKPGNLYTLNLMITNRRFSDMMLPPSVIIVRVIQLLATSHQ